MPPYRSRIRRSRSVRSVLAVAAPGLSTPTVSQWDAETPTRDSSTTTNRRAGPLAHSPWRDLCPGAPSDAVVHQGGGPDGTGSKDRRCSRARRPPLVPFEPPGVGAGAGPSHLGLEERRRTAAEDTLDRTRMNRRRTSLARLFGSDGKRGLSRTFILTIASGGKPSRRHPSIRFGGGRGSRVGSSEKAHLRPRPPRLLDTRLAEPQPVAGESRCWGAQEKLWPLMERFVRSIHRASSERTRPHGEEESPSPAESLVQVGPSGFNKTCPGRSGRTSPVPPLARDVRCRASLRTRHERTPRRPNPPPRA